MENTLLEGLQRIPERPRRRREVPVQWKLELENFGTIPEAVSKTYHASKTKLIGAADQIPTRKAGRKSVSELDQALADAFSYALQHQNEDGHWVAEAESNCSIQAEYVMLRRILGLQNPKVDQKLKRYLLNEQNRDGGWSLFEGAPSCPSVTAEVYFALKLLGDLPEHAHMQRARLFVLGHGGLTQTRIFTRMNFALFGQFDWNLLPALPPEIILLPDSSPFTIYDMSSWARGTVVPLFIIFDAKYVFPIDRKYHCPELFLGPTDEPGPEKKNLDQVSMESLFLGVDKALWFYERLPVKPLRSIALKKAERWILDHQEPSGDWAGIFPPMINSIIALRIRGYSDDHPVIRRGLDAMHHFFIEREDHLRIQCTNSPLWDTALVYTGLLDSGLEPLSPTSRRAASFILKKQIKRHEGDWRVKNKTGQPGGWAFEYFNTWYPDTDDTAALLLALHRVRSAPGGEKVVPSEDFHRGLNWLMSMQSKAGGWGAFDVDNDKEILNRIPFADLKSMIDPPTADVTGRVLELIGRMKARDLFEGQVKNAISFIQKLQCHDGSWWGRWGVNYIYGTCHVLLGLSAIGESAHQTLILRALAWLRSSQNSDGGWGEECLSYNTSFVKARGASTASQTAWGILGLHAFVSHHSLPAQERKACMQAMEKGVEWLIRTQRDDGTWEEAEFTGTGFPQHFYLRYHAYRHAFPLTALGRYKSLGANV